MDKKYLFVMLIVCLFLVGCVAAPVIKEEQEEKNNENYCIDNNGNGICDKNEVPSKVEPVEKQEEVVEEEPIPEEFLEVMENNDKIESYSYIKKRYEDGLESTSIKEKYEVFYRDGKMKQIIGNNIYYINDGVVYDYYEYDNESYVVSDSKVKENTLMEEFEDAENLVVEDDDFNYESKESMIVNYEKDGDFYRATIWKYYAVPLLVEINNQENDGDIIRYEPEINKVKEEDVTLPNSNIVE
jgi:hypothetical protein